MEYINTGTFGRTIWNQGFQIRIGKSIWSFWADSFCNGFQIFESCFAEPIFTLNHLKSLFHVLSWSCVLIPFFAVLLWDIKTQAWWLRTMRRTSIAFSPTCAKAMGSSLVSFHSSKNDSRSSTWNRLATFYCIIKMIYVHWWIINCWPIRIRGLHHYYEKVTVFSFIYSEIFVLNLRFFAVLSCFFSLGNEWTTCAKLIATCWKTKVTKNVFKAYLHFILGVRKFFGEKFEK